MLTPAPGRRWGLAAVLLASAAVGLDHAGARVLGPPAAFVHVRWAPGIDAAERQALELRFSLTGAEPTEGATFSYLLVDTSTANIRALITHRDVLDTHDLDRAAYAVASTAEQVFVADEASQRRSRRFALASRLLWAAAGAIALMGLLIVGVPVTMRRLAAGMRAAARSLGCRVYGGIPEVPVEGAALFRIVFGGALVVLFAQSPLGAGDVPSGPQPEDAAWLTRVLGGVFIAAPRLVDVLGPWLLVSGILFVAGAFTRLSFAAFAVGAVAWGVVYSLQSGHHPVSAPLVALLCLIPSRWGDTWSVDAWVRGAREAANPREYGYTVWIPGVVLGIALAAAATSKLHEGGIGWVLNGTVKYHFVTDAPNALTDWGMRLAVVPAGGIALSFGAVAVESLVLPAALIGSVAVRMAAALAVASMFAGFWLFQGVSWPAWWLLLLSFLPWQLVRRRRRAAQNSSRSSHASTLGRVQFACALAALTQQVTASAWRIEMPPLMSAYDMYSKTHATPDEYPSDSGSSYWLVATMADQATHACRIDRNEAAMFTSDAGWKTQGAADVLASCFDGAGVVQAGTLEYRRPNVDWQAGRYRGMFRVVVSGPVVLAARGAQSTGGPSHTR